MFGWLAPGQRENYESGMDYQCFAVEVSDGIAEVRLNRPEAFNSMIPAFWEELPALVRELDAEEQGLQRERTLTYIETARNHARADSP